MSARKLLNTRWLFFWLPWWTFSSPKQEDQSLLWQFPHLILFLPIPDLISETSSLDLVEIPPSLLLSLLMEFLILPDLPSNTDISSSKSYSSSATSSSTFLINLRSNTCSRLFFSFKGFPTKSKSSLYHRPLENYWCHSIGIRNFSKYKLQASFSFFKHLYHNYLPNYDLKFRKFFQLFCCIVFSLSGCIWGDKDRSTRRAEDSVIGEGAASVEIVLLLSLGRLLMLNLLTDES